MYKEAIKNWSKEKFITIEQYLYVRNGMIGTKLGAGISPHELKKFGIQKMVKGWMQKYGKQSFSVELAKEAAMIGINLKGQKKYVKERLRAAFFMGDFDEQMLYLIENPSGLIKIGISKSPKDRMKRLQTACGEELKLLGCWKVRDKATIIESELHTIFKSKRTLGEWFNLKLNSISDFEKKIPCAFERIVVE